MVGLSMFHLVTSIVGMSVGVRVRTLGPGVNSGGAPNCLVNKATTSFFRLRSKTSMVTNPASSIDHFLPASAVTSQAPPFAPYYRLRLDIPEWCRCYSDMVGRADSVKLKESIFPVRNCSVRD